MWLMLLIKRSGFYGIIHISRNMYLTTENTRNPVAIIESHSVPATWDSKILYWGVPSIEALLDMPLEVPMIYSTGWPLTSITPQPVSYARQAPERSLSVGVHHCRTYIKRCGRNFFVPWHHYMGLAYMSKRYMTSPF